MRIAFRVDAGPVIGGGHAMRCLTLAEALSQRGAEIVFVSTAMPSFLAERMAAAGYKLAPLATSKSFNRIGTDWHEPPLDEATQARDAEATRTLAGNVDWLIVDHYLLDARWHSAARGFAERLLVIDDLANRPFDCDLLVDETEGRSGNDYHGLVPNGAIVLTGAKYALVRPEFPAERPAALERRKDRRPAERILISFGLTDPAAISATATEQALAAAPDCAIDVVVSTEAKSLPLLEELAGKHPRPIVHTDSNGMAELMRDADLAIGAAGTTSWERCCLGLPTVVLTLAENQRSNLDALVRAGAALEVKDAGEIGAAVARLAGDVNDLLAMSRAAFDLTDGRGASRVADIMVSASVEAVRA